MPAHRMLLVVAAPQEAAAVARAFDTNTDPDAPEWAPVELDERFDLVRAGVGKSNAAGAIARLFDPDRHLGAVSTGICGSLPNGPELGACVLATRSVYADEGIATADGFETCAQMGFPLGAGVDAGAEPSPDARAWLAPVCDVSGPIATVSTCSGTDELASAVVSRTGAIAEAMEGAAIAHALRRVSPQALFAELRTVSNHTGERASQAWDIAGALARLTEVLGRARARAGEAFGPV